MSSRSIAFPLVGPPLVSSRTLSLRPSLQSGIPLQEMKHVFYILPKGLKLEQEQAYTLCEEKNRYQPSNQRSQACNCWGSITNHINRQRTSKTGKPQVKKNMYLHTCIVVSSHSLFIDEIGNGSLLAYAQIYSPQTSWSP